MEESGKQPENENAGEVNQRLRAWLSISDDEVGGDSIPIKEEMVEEVMQELLKEINFCHSDNSSGAPLSTPASFPASLSASLSVVMGSGDQERCGSAFSDSSTTLMVGMTSSGGCVSRGKVGFPVGIQHGSWLVGEKVEGPIFMQGDGELMDGYDAVGFSDDEWLRVLTWDSQEIEGTEPDFCSF